MPVNGKSRRAYRGAPVSNTLGVTLSAAATNITLAVAVSGWSTDAEPFFVVVDPGTAKEEKICVKYSSATTLTVVDPAATSTWSASANGRGADNTTDRQHEQGAVIYPVFTATEANQANELVSKYANAGSVVYQGSGTPGTFTELAVGTAAHVLKVNAGATAPEWGQVATAGIADSAVTLAKIADGAVDKSKIGSGPRGIVAFAKTTTSDTTITTEEIQITSSTFTAVADRYYRITYYEPLILTSATALSFVQGIIRLTNLVGTQLETFTVQNPRTTSDYFNGSLIVSIVTTLPAGSTVVVGTLFSSAGTAAANRYSVQPAYICVEDIGTL
jgi:hypothetical protein